MTLEEERLLRLKEYAHHVSQTYQQLVPKISQVTPSSYPLLTISSTDSYTCLYITPAFCCCLVIVATQRTHVRVRRVARFRDHHGHGEPVRRRPERPSAARLLSGTHESGDEQKEKDIRERIFTGLFPTATMTVVVFKKTCATIIITS